MTQNKQTDFGDFCARPHGGLVVVPRHLVTDEAAMRQLGWRVTRRRVEALQYELDVVVLRATQRELVRLMPATFALLGEPDQSKWLAMAVALGDRQVPFILRPSSGASLVLPEKSDQLAVMEKAKAEYLPMLDMLGALTGWTIRMDTTQEGPGIEPAPLPPRHLVIQAMLTPHGEMIADKHGTAYGLPLGDGNENSRAPAIGRGVIITDGEKPVLQVLGQTAYLLIPTMTTYRPVVSKLIFKQLLRSLWNEGIVATAGKLSPTRKTPKILTGEPMIDALIEHVKAIPKSILETLADQERKIAEYEVYLANVRRQAEATRLIIAAVTAADWPKQAAERLRHDLRAIRRDPLVARVRVVDDALQVTTRAVIVEHEGRRYDLGDFTFRMNRYGECSVWNERLTHPGGVPHPHISVGGIPCFGNANDAIRKAAAERRYGDSVRYFLRWIKDGYTHALATTKIETWPALDATAGKEGEP